MVPKPRSPLVLGHFRAIFIVAHRVLAEHDIAASLSDPGSMLSSLGKNSASIGSGAEVAPLVSLLPMLEVMTQNQ